MDQSEMIPPSSETRRLTRSTTNSNKRPSTADLLTTNAPSMPTKTRTRPSVRNNKTSDTSSTAKSSVHGRSRGMISYTHKIAFYGGILSNFHIGKSFRGITVLEHILPALDGLAIVHPAPNSVATQMILAHNFICGEQVMMAMKSYLFECPSLPQANELLSEVAASECGEELSPRPEAFAGMKGTNLAQVLATSDPKKIKALGRRCPNFDPNVWDRASPSVVTAACLARARANPELADLYKENLDLEAAQKEGRELRLKKGFVEGSPNDKIWGVGLRFDDTRIDDQKNWKGGNRLGKCHDEACLLFGRTVTDGSTKLEPGIEGDPGKEQV